MPTTTASWNSSRWPNFTRAEIACPHCNKIIVDEDALDRLQKLRVIMAGPLVLISAYRCADHNEAVGGAPGSMHLKGKAFDIALGEHDRRRLYWSAQIVGFTGFGFLTHGLHVDTGAPRAWNYGPDSVLAWKGIIPPGTKQTGV